MSLKKASKSILCVFLVATLTTAFACSENPSGSSSGDTDDTETKSEILLSDRDYARFSGRVYESDGVFYVSNTASGLKVCTDASDLYIEAEGSEVFEGKTYVCVLINGERHKTLEMGFGKQKYALFEGLSAEKRTIEVLKSTEAQYSSLKFYSISGNGDFYKVPKPCDKKIVFFGDSITCGYGNIGSDSSATYLTKEQDGLETYAFLTAKKLGAEIDVLAASGWAIVTASWHTSDMRIPRVYDKYSPLDDDMVYLDAPDYSADYVIVNLGTNDYTYYANHADKLKDFEDAYYAFYVNLRTSYPLAQIVLTIGMMNFESLIFTMKPYVFRVCDRAAADGDENVSYVDLYTAVQKEDFGSNGHPSVSAHKKAAYMLYDYLISLDAQ